MGTNYIPDYIVDQVIEANDIVSVINSYTKVERNNKCVCPFHQDTKPSLSIHPHKGIFNCFVCGTKGNVIKFVQEYEKISYPEAIRVLANRAGIVIPKEELTPEQIKEIDLKKEIYNANYDAMLFFSNQLKENLNPKYTDYANSRMNVEMISLFNIGYAGGNLKKHLKGLLYSEDVLLKAGLINKSNKDVFFERLIFPIMNERNLVVGFTGRTLEKEKEKYYNTAQTPVYSKQHVLFGLNIALKGIRDTQTCYIVEGNMDVITLNRIGVSNVVATSGTALNEHQINLLKKKGCKKVRIIGDTDKAGLKAMIKNAELFVQHEFETYIVFLPTEKEEVVDEDGVINIVDKKYDADSFFIGRELDFFNEYIEKNAREYIEYYVDVNYSKKNLSPADKNGVKKEIIKLVSCYKPEIATEYISSLKNHIPIKDLSKLYKSEYDRREEEKKRDKQKEARDHTLQQGEIDPTKYIVDDTDKRNHLVTVLPADADRDFYLKYGFFESKGRLYFEIKEDLFMKKTNFVIKPIAHIIGQDLSRRIFTLKNIYNYKVVIDLKQDAMVAVNNFKKEVESKGNFIFEGDSVTLDRLKHYVYHEVLTCQEVEQLGWQKNKDFWAYANGVISNDKFLPINEYGIVNVNDKSYYLDSYSIINKDNETINVEKKKYYYNEKIERINFDYFKQQYLKFYGDNGMLMLCMLFAILHKDIIVNYTNNQFPLIYNYGVRSSGKSTFAKQFMGLFMFNCEATLLHTASISALSRQLSTLCNQPMMIDEFTNVIDKQKLNFLKGFYDCSGRTVTNMDDRTKNVTTKTDSVILMCGQEHINDPALLSRCIVLNFFKTDHLEEDKINNDKFSEIMEKGHTYLIAEMLKYRSLFEEKFYKAYSNSMRNITERVGNGIVARLTKNWCIPLACFDIIKEHIDLGFTYEKLLDFIVVKVVEQQKLNSESSETAVFWESIISLISQGKLRYEYDLEILEKDKIKVEGKEEIYYDELRKLLYINTSKIFDSYLKNAKNNNEDVLSRKSITSYLKNHPSYIGEQKSKSFKLDTFKAGVQELIEIRTRALVFDYSMLDIQLIDFATSQQQEENTPLHVPEQTNLFKK